jgi:uncharacterized protein YlxP (DUF503 family)
MVVGVCRLRLALHDVFSLKEKRSIIKKLIERSRNRFPVSIAEVGDNDVWQSALVVFSIVANDRAFVNSCIDKVIDYIDSLCLAEIVDQDIEIMNFNA